MSTSSSEDGDSEACESFQPEHAEEAVPTDSASPDSETLKKKRGRKNAISAPLAAALDSEKISFRSGVKVVFRCAENFNVDTAEMNVNKSSMHRVRTKCREEKAQKIKDDFMKKLTPNTRLIVHFDGKRMKLSGGNFEERLPVVVTSTGLKEQILGSPVLPDGTGTQQADAVVAFLEEWGLSGIVEGGCSDTTAANTGNYNENGNSTLGNRRG